jgi:hypothetical protein
MKESLKVKTQEMIEEKMKSEYITEDNIPTQTTIEEIKEIPHERKDIFDENQ